MLTVPDAERREEETRPRVLPAASSLRPIERHGYRSPTAGRAFGSVGTIAICSLAIVGLMATLNRLDRPKARSVALVVMALPPAPSPRARPKPIEQPRPVHAPTVESLPRSEPAPVRPTVVPLPAARIVPVGPQTAVADPAPPATVAPPPLAPPAPASPSPASRGPDKWEGRVLARVARFRRYPSDAQHAHIEGTAMVRFRIDRDGHVLSAALERSSGSALLDEAALDTLHRADPMPRIPADRPDEVELVVSVEFSTR